METRCHQPIKCFKNGGWNSRRFMRFTKKTIPTRNVPIPHSWFTLILPCIFQIVGITNPTYSHLVTETSTLNLLCQLDDSKSSREKLVFHHFLPLKTGCLGLFGHKHVYPTKQKKPYVKQLSAISRFTFFVAKLTCAASRNRCGTKSLRCHGAQGAFWTWKYLLAAWMSRWKLGSIVCKWVISPTYKWGILGL